MRTITRRVLATAVAVMAIGLAGCSSQPAPKLPELPPHTPAATSTVPAIASAQVQMLDAVASIVPAAQAAAADARNSKQITTLLICGDEAATAQPHRAFVSFCYTRKMRQAHDTCGP